MHGLAHSDRRCVHEFLTMARLKTIILLLVLIAAIAFAGLLASSERNRTALLNQQGFIVSGGKFGVSIGQSTEDAAVILRRSNFQYVDTKNGGYCVHHHYPDDTKVIAFFDGSWRQIAVCIGAKGGRVTSIEWNAMPFTPEL